MPTEAKGAGRPEQMAPHTGAFYGSVEEYVKARGGNRPIKKVGGSSNFGLSSRSRLLGAAAPLPLSAPV